MLKEKEINELKERVNNIDPIETEAVIMFIGTPSNLQIHTSGRDEAIAWIFEAISSAITSNVSDRTDEPQEE